MKHSDLTVKQRDVLVELTSGRMRVDFTEPSVMNPLEDCGLLRVHGFLAASGSWLAVLTAKGRALAEEIKEME